MDTIALVFAVKFVQKFVELKAVIFTKKRFLQFYLEKKMNQMQDLLSLKIVAV